MQQRRIPFVLAGALLVSAPASGVSPIAAQVVRDTLTVRDTITARDTVVAAPDTAGPPPPLRIFFIADAHSRFRHIERFLADAEQARPDIVLDAGDVVHDGTESEFRRAQAYREQLALPWHTARGNHDADLRGPFRELPALLPSLHAVDHDGVRIILLDNHDERLSDYQFERLEAELVAHADRTTIVVMHVPPFISREPPFTRLRHLVPFPLASPVMRDPAEAARFSELVERHGVRAVLTGHLHAFDHQVRNGVHYITGGALGGLTPGFRIPNEYAEITIDADTVEVRRVRVARPPREPVTLIVRVFRFYAQLNAFNHAAQGWNYIPSASVQLRGGIERVEGGPAEHALWSEAAFERTLGRVGRHAFTTDVGIVAGRNVQLARVSTGYRVRPLGDYNRNLFIGGSALANGGLLEQRATAGIGVRGTAGAEWRWLTFELGHTRATNQRTTHIGIGRRF